MNQFAAFVYTHNNPALTFDTVDSVQFWVSPDVMVLVDAAGWQNFHQVPAPCPLVKGLLHGQPKSPYRNVAFGLLELSKRFPDAQWYVYVEQDCLFGNAAFKEDLAKNPGKWFAGTNLRGPRQWKLPKLNEIVGGEIEEEVYVLGCVMFFHRNFVNQLKKDEVIDRLIQQTESLPTGVFPGFTGYAFEEQLFASLANYYKKNSVLGLSHEDRRSPRHNWLKYVVRWQPDIEANEVSPGASIIHPSKNPYSTIRCHYRKFRDKVLKRNN